MSTVVEPGYGAWLKTPARYVTATIAGAAATWADRVADSTVITPLADKAAAQAEANYQAQFLAGPITRDKIVVPGLRSDLIGCVVTVKGDRLGYENGDDVFVIGAQEAERVRLTTLTVLKRL